MLSDFFDPLDRTSVVGIAGKCIYQEKEGEENINKFMTAAASPTYWKIIFTILCTNTNKI